MSWVRWARERGWLEITDPSTGQRDEILASDAPRSWVREAMREKDDAMARRRSSAEQRSVAERLEGFLDHPQEGTALSRWDLDLLALRERQSA